MSNPVVRNIHININGKEVVNSYAGISKAMREVNRDIANLNKNDDDYQEQLRKHRATLGNLREEYERFREEIGRVPGTMEQIKDEIGNIGTGMMQAFTVGAIVGKVVTEFNLARETVEKFDQAQADLAGVMETNKAGIKDLTEDAKRYGATTSFSATQVSSLQLELAKLGKTEVEIKGMTKGVLDAAVALDAELGPAAELVGGQLNSFGEDADQAQRYADVMANSANISATSFESLSTALPKVSAVAAQMNISFERTNAVLGVLADQNVAAETSGTGFRNILLTASKEGRNYEEMLREVANSTDSTKKATELFGKENATVAVILSQSFDKVNEATKKLENSVGSAAALAETKLDSVTGAQTLFNSAWEGMILSFDDGNGPIAEVTKNLYGLGTEILGLITPSNNLSDALLREQVELNSLVGRITSTNVSNDERKRLIEELKATYPGFIGMIDDENFSNTNLKKTLFQVNEQYRERILLQSQVERAEKARESRDKQAGTASKIELELAQKLNKVIAERGYKYTVDYSNIAKSAKEIQSLIKKEGGRTGIFSDYADIKLSLENLDLYNKAIKQSNIQLKEEQKTLEEIKKSTGQITEAERQQNELAKEREKADEEARKRATAFNAQSGSKEKTKEELKAEKAAAKKSERDAEALKRKKEREVELFKRGEEQIDEILQRSREERDSLHLKGIAKEEAQITAKYTREIEKFKGHTERIKELEEARDAEIEAAKQKRTVEYAQRQAEIDEENRITKLEAQFENDAENARSEEERQLILIEKAREVALLEIDIEREKELAKIEAVEGAEELKASIREKYALQEENVRQNFAKAERNLKNQQVDWTKLTEEQKLDAVKSSLNGAAEAFNQGSGAWKATKIAETVITTYQSATNAFNSLSGIPIVGPALGAAAAALAVVSGIKNVQKISQTPLQKMPTYYYGGYTSTATGSFGGDEFGNFTGAVHANEWVSPAFMTQSPRYAPIINWLDTEREMMLNGFSSSSTANPFTDNPTMKMLAITLSELNSTLQTGITSKNVWGYEDLENMNKMNTELGNSKKNAIIS